MAPGWSDPDAPARARVAVRGLVQGVGFRPFIHRLAGSLSLTGWVRNDPSGAQVEVEGRRAAVEDFLARLGAEPPSPCRILHVETVWLSPRGPGGFQILPSVTDGVSTALILPDLAMCADCRRELHDPADRRHRYPFINCTQCGPRYSIIRSLPYDRARTSMSGFALCPDCRREYEDPADRRFHAEPIACPRCGPRLALRDPHGKTLDEGESALRSAVEALRDGRILALKGLGGFQLLVRADLDSPVARLRRRKRREAKPLAVMCRSIETVRLYGEVSTDEERLLASSAAPIVLLSRRSPALASLAASVAPENPWLGVMLPYTPLHHLLLTELDLPLVATSGNLSDEPLCIDECEALQRLAGVADLFLVHDRPIVRPVDDSVARVLLGTTQVLRRARGYAPLPTPLPSGGGRSGSGPILAVGAHLKNTLAMARDGEVFLSQHLGDLETARAAEVFEQTLESLPRLLDIVPESIAMDLHPDYLTTQRAATLPGRHFAIPHHEAHAWACLADNELPLPALALCWDGAGLGPDGTIWGGEFLELTARDCRRRAWVRPFPIPGGDRAARDPRRSALGLLHAARLLENPAGLGYLAEVFTGIEASVLRTLLASAHHAPRTSSLGRLFDALASLLRLTHASRYEGEAAQRLEWAAWRAWQRGEPSPIDPLGALVLAERDPGLEVDWQPFLESLLDRDPGLPSDGWALAWHRALAGMAAAVARRLLPERVLLTGGCFQNRLLTELTVAALRADGFNVYWHQRIPPNDGGIALGQAAAVSVRTARPDPRV